MKPGFGRLRGPCSNLSYERTVRQPGMRNSEIAARRVMDEQDGPTHRIAESGDARPGKKEGSGEGHRCI